MIYSHPFFSKVALCFATLCFIQDLKAQTPDSKVYYDPYERAALPAMAPVWMQQIVQNPTGVNVHTMDSLFNDWLDKDWEAKIKTVDKKPAVNFFRRWRKAYQPYIQPNGQIQLPTIDQMTAKLDRDNMLSKLSIQANKQPIWRNIGPNTTRSIYNVKDSQACVFRVDASRTNNNIVYVGAETGVVFKTTDKGHTWHACNGSFNFGTVISAIAVDPHNPDIVYVGSDIGLWKSTDGGENWQRMAPTTVRTRVNSIKIDPQESNIVTLVSENRSGGPWDSSGNVDGGFCVSRDGGNSFENKINGYGYDHELKPDDPNTIYVLIREKGKNQGNGGTQLFVYNLKTDTKHSYNILQDFTSRPVMAGRLSVSHAPGGQNYLYALVTEDRGYSNPRGEGLAYILQSKDCGQSWTNHTVRPKEATLRKGASFWNIDNEGGQGYFDMAIQASNKNPEHVLYGLTCLYRSTQGGAGGWDRFSQGTGIGGYVAQENMHPDIQDICVVGDDTWVVNDGGIQYSQDFFETKGEIRVNGIYAADYHGFSQGWNEDVMAGGRWHNGDAIHAKSYGEGNTLHVGGVEKATGYVFLHDPYLVFFSDASAGTYKIPKNIEGNVEELYNSLFTQMIPYEVLRSNGKLAFDPRYAQRLITVLESRNPYTSTSSRDQLYVSENYGRSFTLLKNTDGDNILDYDFARSNPNVIYMITNFDFYVSQDNGATWQTKTRPFTYDNSGNNPVMLSIDPMDANTIWATDVNKEKGVKISKDGGETWSDIDYNGIQGKKKFYWIVLTGDAENTVYMASSEEAKVYYRNNSMDHWQDYSLGLNPGARITKLVPFYKEGLLRAATNQGIWEAKMANQNFRPIAQPMSTSLSMGNITSGTQVQFESYSHAKQTAGTQWEWTITPMPQHIDSRTIRNPKVVFTQNGAYDVTLKVTHEDGQTHSRTIKKMIIVGEDDTNNGILPGTGTDDIEEVGSTVGLKQLKHNEADAAIIPNIIVKGENTTLRTCNLSGEVQLNLYDIKGRKKKEFIFSEATENNTLTTQDLTNGVYIYEIIAHNFRGYGKILIR